MALITITLMTVISGGVIMGAAVHKLKRLNFQLLVAVAIQTLFLALSALDTPRTTAQTLAFHFLATVPFAWYASSSG